MAKNQHKAKHNPQHHSKPQNNDKRKYLGLREAILLGLRYNPVVKNTELNRVVDKFNLLQAQREYELQFALTGSAQWTRAKSSGDRSPDQTAYNLTHTTKLKVPIGTQLQTDVTNDFSDNAIDGFSHHPTVKLSITQPLIKGAGTTVNLASLRNAYSNEASQRLAYKQSIIDSIDTVIRDYRQLILDNYQIVSRHNGLKRAVDAYKFNVEKIKVGQMAKVENLQQKVQVESLRLELERATNRKYQNVQQLLVDIWIKPDFPVKVPNDVEIKDPVVPDLHDSIETALQHNTKYQQDLLSLDQARRDLIVAKDNLRWQLDFTADHTQGSSGGTGKDAGLKSLSNDRNWSTSLGLQLSVPIDNFDDQKAYITQKVAVHQQENSVAVSRRTLIRDVTNQIIEIHSQAEQLKIAESGVIAAEKAFEAELKKQQLGRSTALDVSNSQDNLLTAESQVIVNKLSYLDAIDKLQNIMGTTLEFWGIQVRY